MSQNSIVLAYSGGLDTVASSSGLSLKTFGLSPTLPMWAKMKISTKSGKTAAEITCKREFADEVSYLSSTDTSCILK